MLTQKKKKKKKIKSQEKWVIEKNVMEISTKKRKKNKKKKSHEGKAKWYTRCNFCFSWAWTSFNRLARSIRLTSEERKIDSISKTWNNLNKFFFSFLFFDLIAKEKEILFDLIVQEREGEKPHLFWAVIEIGEDVRPKLLVGGIHTTRHVLVKPPVGGR